MAGPYRSLTHATTQFIFPQVTGHKTLSGSRIWQKDFTKALTFVYMECMSRLGLRPRVRAAWVNRAAQLWIRQGSPDFPSGLKTELPVRERDVRTSLSPGEAFTPSKCDMAAYCVSIRPTTSKKAKARAYRTW